MTDGPFDQQGILVTAGPFLDMAPDMDPVANPYPRDFKPKRDVLPPLNRRIWLITFTDTISLMVAFFVLMYAMSDPQLQDYKKIAIAMQQQFSVEKTAPTKTYAASPANMGDADTVSLPRARMQSSLEGTYLRQVVEQQLRERPELGQVSIRSVQRDVILDVPMAALFDGTGYRPIDKADVVTKQFSHIFMDLPNRIEIVVDLAGGADTDVLVALMRGQNVLADLRAQGYRQDMSILVNKNRGKPVFHFRLTHFTGRGP